ncbi:MAG: hypothetical protein WEC75_00145 [Dehalococcoidia bacterium]
MTQDATAPPTRRLRPLFAAYQPAPVNDAGAPPFPAFEADEEEEGRAESLDLDFERPQANWAPLPPGVPTSDVPVRFIDGSVVTRTAASLLVGGRTRPLMAAVVAATALELDGRVLRRPEGARTRKIVCVYSDGMDRADLIEAAEILATIGVELRERPTGAVGDFDMMRRATRSLAMDEMERMEQEVLLDDPRKPTLVDGLLERRLAATPSHDVPVVGLVKRQMTQYLPPALQELTYRLQPGERTPAFILRTVQHVDLVNTYVRLSAQTGASPSYGVVRVTAPLDYVERAHGERVTAYLSGLAAYLYRLRHRDLAYARSGISVEPIVRVETHLHAILPEVETLVPKLHRLFRGAA